MPCLIQRSPLLFEAFPETATGQLWSSRQRFCYASVDPHKLLRSLWRRCFGWTNIGRKSWQRRTADHSFWQTKTDKTGSLDNLLQLPRIAAKSHHIYIIYIYIWYSILYIYIIIIIIIVAPFQLAYVFFGRWDMWESPVLTLQLDYHQDLSERLGRIARSGSGAEHVRNRWQRGAAFLCCTMFENEDFTMFYRIDHLFYMCFFFGKWSQIFYRACFAFL